MIDIFPTKHVLPESPSLLLIRGLYLASVFQAYNSVWGSDGEFFTTESNFLKICLVFWQFAGWEKELKMLRGKFSGWCTGSFNV